MEKEEILKSIQKYCFPKKDYQEVQGDDGGEVRINVHDNDENYIKCDNESGNNARSEERSCHHIENENSNRSTSAMLGLASRDHKSFVHSEKFKALLTFGFLVISFLISTISLAFTHDRVPDRTIYKPLPDAILDSVSNIDVLLNIAEIQIIVIVNVCILLVFFHKHRFVIAKRCFFLLSILYLYRSITMYVTVLPVSSNTYYCSPKSNSTSSYEIIKRALTLFSGMGLSINHKQFYCGDSIFSGHTTILFFGYLVLDQYSPKRLRLYLSVLGLLNAIVGVTFILVSHMHYTIDIIIAYYLTTRLFWCYHSTLNCATQPSSTLSSSSNSAIRREWFWPMYKYLEGDSPPTIANRGFTNELEFWPFKK